MKAYQVEIETKAGRCHIVWPGDAGDMRTESLGVAELRFNEYRAALTNGATDIEGMARGRIGALILREVDVPKLLASTRRESQKVELRREPVAALRVAA